MKLRHLPSFCVALLALCPTLAIAQTSAVPSYISYQGFVVDAQGIAVGAGSPVNRPVIFRIWGHVGSTLTEHLIYSEQQTVTINDGRFSVLVGQGVPNLAQAYGYDESPKKLDDLGGAFNGRLRYLGVTVGSNATIATTDNEISPRQQIVSTAFAMRAKFAESISSSSDLRFNPTNGTASNYGLGWYGLGRPFSGTEVDGPVLYGNAGGALGSSVSGTQQTALRWDASGRVGIGATHFASTSNKLTLQGDMATTPADQLTIRGNLDNDKRMLLGYDTTANKATLQSYSGTQTSSPLLLNPNGGNVGINSTSPGVALEVSGTIKANEFTTTGKISAGQLYTTGEVGIGGTGWAKLFVGGGVGKSNFYGPYIEYGAIVQNGHKSGTVPMGIWASSGIVTNTGFYVTSDARMKTIEGVSNGDADLQTLLEIEITDYHYLDTIAKGDATQKKVIAQQVEKVFPLAVKQTTDVVPDIYQKAAMTEGWIKLETSLKKGDRVRLIDNRSSETYEVLEVKEDQFRTSFQSTGGQVFVFGREVTDFRVVDYEAISMLNVSATQQLKREKDGEIQALRDENAALRRDLAAKDESLEARLIALERSMLKAASVKTVSLRTASVVE